MLIKKDRLFYLVSFLLSVGLFSFHYWMAYPGYADWESMEHLTLGKEAWKGPFITHCLIFLGYFFGRHTYFMLLMNLIPVYLGTWIITVGCYKKFHSFFALLFLLLLGTQNVFYGLFDLGDTQILASSMFWLYALCLYGTLAPPRTKIGIFLLYFNIGFAFIFCLFSRYNAIAFVWPVCLIFIYNIVVKFHLKVKSILALIVGSLSVIGLTGFLFLKNAHSFPANHILLHQIAGCCVPANDSSCFKSTWYKHGKTWEDVKITYTSFPMNADFIALKKDSIFKRNIPPQDLFRGYIQAIIKYPSNYLQHVGRFIKKNAQLKFWATKSEHFVTVEKKRLKEQHEKLLKMYPLSETKISFSEQQKNIYSLFRLLPKIDPIHSLLLSLIFLVAGIGLFLFCQQGKRLSVLILSSALSSCSGFLICSCFSPIPLMRYIYPLFFSSVISLICMLIFPFLIKNVISQP